MGSGSEWEELVEAIAQELIPFLQTTLLIRRYENHVNRIRSMSAPSEKLFNHLTPGNKDPATHMS